MGVGFHQRGHCPLCESTSSKVLCEIPYRDKRLATFIEQFYHGKVPPKVLASETYRVVACANCDFIYQDPILNREGMQALYQDWIDHAQSLHKKETAKSKVYRQYAGQVHTLSRLFDKQPGQVRVLDFGMGWGYWSRMAQAHGFDVVGFEMSAERSEYARQMGVSVVDDLAAVEDGFDCVYANQVFEHLPDPIESLRTICQHLNPDGVIYIRVPDGRGVDQSLARRHWSPELDAIHPLEHINCFTRKTLISFAASVGLTPFNPPLRLNWGSLWGGIRREIADRWLTTHLFLRR